MPRHHEPIGTRGEKMSDTSTGADVSRTQQAGQAVSDVKDTVAEQAQRVGSEARTQARTVATDVRDRLGERARTQNDRLVSSIRETADHLDEMRGDRSGTPAATVVSRVADGGRQLADYLDRNGPEGVLAEVQDFARRRPGAFLATALAAGFVVGRLGKSVAKAGSGTGPSAVKPVDDQFVTDYQTTAPSTVAAGYPTAATTGYATPGEGYTEVGNEYAPPGTEYAATGTGTPAAVEETVIPSSEPRP
jgi:hypothetical protein